MKDTHFLIAAAIAAKALLITVITLVVKLKGTVKELKEGMATIGVKPPAAAGQKTTVEQTIEEISQWAKVIVELKKEEQAQLRGVAQAAKTPTAPASSVVADDFLWGQLQEKARLACCSATHNPAVNARHLGTPIVFSYEGLRLAVLDALNKARLEERAKAASPK